MRRAKMAGRHIGKAPFGYANMTAIDGRKYIIPKHPEADHILKEGLCRLIDLSGIEL
jgi:site-specific DNA recombinase